MKMKDLFDELFESKEMAEYLTANADKLSEYNILSAVCLSPLDIWRKAELLYGLSKNQDIEKEICNEINRKNVTDEEKNKIRKYITENSYAYAYNQAIDIISHLNSVSGDVFIVKCIWRDDDYPYGRDESADVCVCADFDSALQAVENYMESECVSWQNCEYFWFEIRKWSLDENKKYKEIICYYLIDNKIMFAKKAGIGHFKEKFKPDCNLNLITPFNTGDIVNIDCRPHQATKNVLILENVTNYDCCSLQALYLDEKGLLKTGAVKHATQFWKFYCADISPLYKVTTVKEPLRNREKILEKVRDFIGTDTQKGTDFWNYIHTIDPNLNGVKSATVEKYIKENTK